MVALWFTTSRLGFFRFLNIRNVTTPGVVRTTPESSKLSSLVAHSYRSDGADGASIEPVKLLDAVGQEREGPIVLAAQNLMRKLFHFPNAEEALQAPFAGQRGRRRRRRDGRQGGQEGKGARRGQGSARRGWR